MFHTVIALCIKWLTSKERVVNTDCFMY